MGELPPEVHDLLKSFDSKIEGYETLYKHFHQNPELSKYEKETSQLVEKKLRELSSDLEIKTGIGGYGLIAILRNGQGKTILLRSDMDALPIKEKTGLEYQSEKYMDDAYGISKPVMHACGHDFHTTCGLAAAELIISAKKQWSGTCIFLFQPAEEAISGAQSMVDDGLYDSNKHGCPIPDFVLGQHVIPMPAGFVGTRPGPMMAASDSIKVVVHGKGGHASMPNRTVDPVLIASQIVVRLQTIVSREVAPDQIAVVTVGSIKAGDAPNVIPDHAEIKINIRNYEPKTREHILSAIKRIINAECEAGRSPREASIDIFESAPRLDNDEALYNVVGNSFSKYFGERYIANNPRFPGSEDFPILGTAINKPSLFWFFGGYTMDTSEKLSIDDILGNFPGNHSPFFAPDLEPTLKTGIHAMVVAALAAFGAEIK